MMITAFLCGLWTPILILVAITNQNPMRCQTCGGIDKPPVKISIPSVPKQPELPELKEIPKPPREKWVPTHGQTVALVALGSIALIAIVFGFAWIFKR